MINLAINGFGRIGRCVFRAWLENYADAICITKINSTVSPYDSMHLLKYDSILGRMNFEFVVHDSCVHITYNGIEHVIEFVSTRDISGIDWDGCDIVMECTGKFTSHKDAAIHLNSAKRVIISAPGKEKDIPMLVYGVNNDRFDFNHKIISVGSCTTNCLAPIAKVLDKEFGILNGFMTTIHSYTGDQNLVDGSHKDLRRGRAAALSMIPTSTGAAKSIASVLPNLEGKLDGSAIRVPTPNVSVIDLVANLNGEVTTEVINSVFASYADNDLKDVMMVENETLVSCDFIKSKYSCIIDAAETRVVANKCVRILAWYDNEFGFSMRMLDVAKMFIDK